MDKSLYGRKDRLIKEKRHDAYQERGKWPEPTRCTECGAVFMNGRWSWQKTLEAVNTALCPACRRIADNYPAGSIDLKGSFLTEHRDEILNLILNIEKAEKADHPLERIISTVGTNDAVSITTTGMHLARRIGEALSRAYKGELSVQYAEESIKVSWQREL